MKLATGAAPGKVILFGEHSVVYGRPAIAASLGQGLGATVEAVDEGPILRIPGWGRGGLHVHLDPGRRDFDAIARAFAVALDAADLGRPNIAVTLDGELPPGVGLGSSAAFAVAILRALGQHRGAAFSDETLLAAAAEIEGVFHGTPSGIDHTVVMRGGCLRFQRGADQPIQMISCPAPLPVVIGWAPRDGGTKQVVAGLRARRDAHPVLYGQLFDAMGAVAEAGAAALRRADLAQLGALFDLAHGYLNACGVSNLDNERMVRVARESGALGAKLTGAGNGGAVVAVAPKGRDAIVKALRDAGFRAFATTVG